ncbi:uncharacterized protein BDW47DRAFT_27916 [Aspergillus candidus]|uniref:Uncharacterized protein n=1 Tax=Aspergillus candidus TaxID=41067 RepID=A0A2I2FCF8_ASPCN|nr:hypothetical protein BDW47DRAFT_27916 [Aspergillus candidus]PLB38314.1 hypothetical protein BDW47DRAFT_27916 [Aspergillus candidus]
MHSCRAVLHFQSGAVHSDPIPPQSRWIWYRRPRPRRQLVHRHLCHNVGTEKNPCQRPTKPFIFLLFFLFFLISFSFSSFIPFFPFSLIKMECHRYLPMHQQVQTVSHFGNHLHWSIFRPEQDCVAEPYQGPGDLPVSGPAACR